MKECSGEVVEGEEEDEFLSRKDIKIAQRVRNTKSAMIFLWVLMMDESIAIGQA